MHKIVHASGSLLAMLALMGMPFVAPAHANPCGADATAGPATNTAGATTSGPSVGGNSGSTTPAPRGAGTSGAPSMTTGAAEGGGNVTSPAVIVSAVPSANQL